MIINTSNFRAGTGGGVQGTLAAACVFEADFTATVLTARVRANLNAAAVFDASFNGAARRLKSLVVRCRFSANFNPSVALGEIEPDPILITPGASAFANQNYAVRLLRNGVEIPFRRAALLSPTGSIGKSLQVDLSRPDESILAGNPDWTFQIGIMTASTIAWSTLIDTAKWNGKTFGTAWEGDTLSVSMTDPKSDLLNLSPRVNRIYYNPAKTTVIPDTSNILRDNFGDEIPTVITAKNVLSLYDAFRYAFVNGCGFASFVTNIPNFEITRVDFSITNTYQEAVAGFIGMYEPIYFTAGEILYILDKTTAIPEGFEPRSVAAAKYPRFSRAIAAAQKIDAFQLEYNQTGNFNYYTQRFEYELRESGSFGNPNFTRTETTEEFRDYRNTSNPSVIIKTELKNTTTTVENWLGVEISSESEDYVFDSSGRITSKTKTHFSLVPNLADDGNLLTQKMREETQTYSYITDRFSPRASFMASRVSVIRALIATDAENQYLGNDFLQEYLEAHRAGNLTTEMTTNFDLVKTVREDFEQLSREQVRMKRTIIDHLRDVPVEQTSETANGTNSINSFSPQPKKMVVWKTGTDRGSDAGAHIVPFAVGELPLTFSLPLALRKLDNQQVLQTGNIEIAGFDESVERGVFFRPLGRETDESFGTFIVEGYTVRVDEFGTPQARITTTIEAAEVIAL